jgi:hypothetical protein
MAFPIDYQWCLCGQVLGQGQGTLVTDGHTITYFVDRDQLQIGTEIGKSLKCELCLSAIDNWGRELFTCVPLERRGTVVRLEGLDEGFVLQSRLPKYVVELPPLTQRGIEFLPQRGANFDPKLLPVAREILENFEPRPSGHSGPDTIPNKD